MAGWRGVHHAARRWDRVAGCGGAVVSCGRPFPGSRMINAGPLYSLTVPAAMAALRFAADQPLAVRAAAAAAAAGAAFLLARAVERWVLNERGWRPVRFNRPARRGS